MFRLEIDFNARIEFWKKSNFRHFAIFAYFSLYISLYVLLYMYVYYVEVNSYLNFFGWHVTFVWFLIRIITVRITITRRWEIAFQLRLRFRFRLRIWFFIIFNIFYPPPGNEFTFFIDFNASSTNYMRDIPILFWKVIELRLGCLLLCVVRPVERREVWEYI